MRRAAGAPEASASLTMAARARAERMRAPHTSTGLAALFRKSATAATAACSWAARAAPGNTRAAMVTRLGNRPPAGCPSRCSVLPIPSHPTATCSPGARTRHRHRRRQRHGHGGGRVGCVLRGRKV